MPVGLQSATVGPNEWAFFSDGWGSALMDVDLRSAIMTGFHLFFPSLHLSDFAKRRLVSLLRLIATASDALLEFRSGARLKCLSDASATSPCLKE